MSDQGYDRFSADYDKFVNWENRLRYELPFIDAQLNALGGGARVLDAACGTGMHAIALAQKGFGVAGSDLSAGMVEQARVNAKTVELDIRFEQAGFGELFRVFGTGVFDAVLCLGNSLPHILDAAELKRTLADFAACLRNGGLLLVQNRNFDAVITHKERWMEPQARREGSDEWLFLRFYDYLPDGSIGFNIMTLQRAEDGVWQQSITTTPLRPILEAELSTVLREVGFESIATYGDMSGSPFDQTSSGNLIVTAIKKGD
jgi:glycine/sarcosine N-methyltransferase